MIETPLSPPATVPVNRPSKSTLVLGISIILLLFAIAGGGGGFLLAAAFTRPLDRFPAILGCLLLSVALVTVISQCCNQATLRVLIVPGRLRVRRLLRSHEFVPGDIEAVYLAPNAKYYNVIIATRQGPVLLSSLLWRGRDFEQLVSKIVSWCEINGIHAPIKVDSVSPSTPDEKRVRFILVRSFRKDLFVYVAAAGVSTALGALIIAAIGSN